MLGWFRGPFCVCSRVRTRYVDCTRRCSRRFKLSRGPKLAVEARHKSRAIELGLLCRAGRERSGDWIPRLTEVRGQRALGVAHVVPALAHCMAMRARSEGRNARRGKTVRGQQVASNINTGGATLIMPKTKYLDTESTANVSRTRGRRRHILWLSAPACFM